MDADDTPLDHYWLGRDRYAYALWSTEPVWHATRHIWCNAARTLIADRETGGTHLDAHLRELVHQNHPDAYLAQVRQTAEFLGIQLQLGQKVRVRIPRPKIIGPILERHDMSPDAA